MESDIRAIQDANDAAAAKEIGELRFNTIKGLKYALKQEGAAGVINLLREAAVLTPVFDWFVDGKRAERGVAGSNPESSNLA